MADKIKDRKQELRDMTPEKLNETLKELKAELFNLRFQLAANQLENTARLKAVKKDIARVKTCMRAAQPAAKA